MTMPSTREVSQAPSPESPRGIWTVRYPAPGVYAELHGVTSTGRRIAEMYASNDAELVAMGHAIAALLDRLDPMPLPTARRHLEIVPV